MGPIFENILSDLKEYLKYLASAWGLLSTITPFFPLFSSFSKLMPPPKIYSDFFILLAILCGIFAVFYNFTHRDIQKSTSAKQLFFTAIGVTMAYLIVVPALPTIPIEQQLGLPHLEPVVQAMINLLNALWLTVNPILYIMSFVIVHGVSLNKI